MQHDEVLAHVAGLEVLEELSAIRAACDTRAKQLRDKRWQEKCDETWTRYRNLKPGVVVWCYRQGVEIGGSGFQRGDRATVHSVQKRAKRLAERLGRVLNG